MRVSVWFAIALGLSVCVQAHEIRPINVEVTELSADSYRVRWRVPDSIPKAEFPEVSIQGCTSRSRGAYGPEGLTALFSCSGKEAARGLKIHWQDFNPVVSTFVVLNYANGQSFSEVLSPDQQVWRFPDQETLSRVSLTYFSLGVEHIIKGFDHLLFVFCLCVVCSSPRRILLAVSGFTVAHSLTLALSTLKLLHVPIAPTEAAIALSIVFLAREMFLNDRTSLTWRYPSVVATVFGLLHGLGFASALTEMGLPQTQRIAALALFNLGVEFGQLALVFTLLFLAFATKIHRNSAERFYLGLTRHFVPVVVGGISTFWFLERTAKLL